MSKFQIHTIDTAPEAAKEALQAVKNNNGFIPNLIGVLANAPGFCLVFLFIHMVLDS